ncbi:ClbS/DfsB family four-helix bundle protein [Edaphovirga cremea]|uniref:ClbS/DfsB family four-helix bundle protein n=1 Tax=Edaphovirga cremea TaxID=2267246 RepID=UPI003989D40C
MAVPQNRDELLSEIARNYERLRKDLIALPVERSVEKSLEGHAKGTVMSACNLVAYLLGWNELVLKWIARHKDGQEIDFPETGFKWNQLGRLAQKFYEDYEALTYQELIERLDSAKKEIVTFIESTDNHDLYECAWYDKWTMGRMIQFNTLSPYLNARVRVRKWAKQQGITL